MSVLIYAALKSSHILKQLTSSEQEGQVFDWKFIPVKTICTVGAWLSLICYALVEGASANLKKQNQQKQTMTESPILIYVIYSALPASF